MTTAAATTTWEIDPVHSIAEFSVKHMMISTVKGRFRNLAGTIQLDEVNPTNSSVTAALDVASIETGEAQRDGHLRSDDFFNAERYPQITFHSSRIEQKSDEEWKIAGQLTIRDVTRDVTLDTEYSGQVTDPYGKQRTGFTAETTLSRKEFGLKANPLLEAGGAVVGDRVKVTLHLEAIRQD